MVSFHSSFIEHRRNILDYLRSLHLLRSNLDVTIWDKDDLSGSLNIRDGVVMRAQCGKLEGNGAALTLGNLKHASLHAVSADATPAVNVTLGHVQLESFLRESDSSPIQAYQKGFGEILRMEQSEEKALQEMVASFFQLDRKDAAGLCLQILKKNRFYYPAWLWYSRLLTHRQSIRKALNEALLWGNDDREVHLEVAKVEPRLVSLPDRVKKCFFCFCPASARTARCGHCGALMSGHGLAHDPLVQEEVITASLARYEEQLSAHPNNVKIMYVLALGCLSLGDRENGRAHLLEGLAVLPGEKLLLSLLDQL